MSIFLSDKNSITYYVSHFADNTSALMVLNANFIAENSFSKESKHFSATDTIY